MRVTETERRAAALLRSEYEIPEYLRHHRNVEQAEGILARAWLRQFEQEKPEDQYTTLDEFPYIDFNPWLYDVRAEAYIVAETELALLRADGESPLALFGTIST